MTHVCEDCGAEKPVGMLHTCGQPPQVLVLRDRAQAPVYRVAPPVETLAHALPHVTSRVSSHALSHGKADKPSSKRMTGTERVAKWRAGHKWRAYHRIYMRGWRAEKKAEAAL
jgi:hypothetical protein